MRALFDGLALVVGGAGLVALGLAVAVGRRWRPGLAFALDMWTAGGLLLLAGGAGGPGWDRIAAAAAIVAVRTLVGSGRTLVGSGRTLVGSGRTRPGSGRTRSGSARRRGDSRRGEPISGRAPEPPLAGGR